MFRKWILSAAASLALVCGAHAAPVGISGSGATGVSYSGSLDYNAATSILTVVLTNTSSGSITHSSLTAFAFNITGDVYLEEATTPFLAGWNSLTNPNDIGDRESSEPYGFFEAAAGIHSDFLNGAGSGPQSIPALQNGQSGTWSWLIKHKDTDAAAAGAVSTNSFLSEGSTGGSHTATFLARFKGIKVNGSGDGSDKVVATGVPLPSAAWAGLALLGGLGLAKLRRRRIA